MVHFPFQFSRFMGKCLPSSKLPNAINKGDGGNQSSVRHFALPEDSVWTNEGNPFSEVASR